MRIKLRFFGFIAVGLFAYFFWMTGFVLLFSEVILPRTATSDDFTTAVVWICIVFSALSGAVFLSYWFVKPIAAMLRMIRDISAGRFNRQVALRKIYKKSQKLKARYWLYRELVSDVGSLAEQLEQADAEREKLEQAKRDWVRGISHDIKTPLSYVVGYSSLLLSQDHDWSREEQREFLNQIYEKGKYIESLVNNLNLSFRLEDHANPLPLNMTVFDLRPFLEKLVADLRGRSTDKSRSVALHIAERHLAIEADNQLLYRAIFNLVDNAISHNPAGTEVQIEVKRDGKDFVCISVRDNGVGMPQDVTESLFGKHDTPKTAASGKKDYAGGLGLSIVKSIVEAHNGHVSAHGNEGAGVAVAVRLPLHS
jgi:signal transduction histidine kinase